LNRRDRRVSLVAVIAVLACKGRGELARDTPRSIEATRTPTAVTAPVTERGIGPLRVGMSVAQAREALPGLEEPKEGRADVCEYTRGGGLPEGVMVMVENGIVVRVDVDTNAVPTADGARVGDSVARIRSIYGSRVSSAPNKYTAEPDLTIRAADPADSAYEMIFETLKGKVVRYRGGQRPQVRYVEGCS
jgi:hypothetical protein